MNRHWLRKAPKILVIATVAITVLTFVVMTLWNALIPPLFKGPVLTFWQTLGLLVLAKILGKVLLFRGPSGPPPWVWRRRMMERWDQMSPEEREQFRLGLKSRGGPFGPPESKP
jgi:hypothetical protein